MKINMPSLKVDMVLSEVRIKDGRPVIICEMGAYEATAELSRSDVANLLKQFLRPRVFIAFARLLLSRPGRS